MNVGLRWVLSVLAVGTLACAGGGGNSGDGICRITPTEGLLPIEVTMTDDAREVTLSRGNGESREIHTFDAEQRLVRTNHTGVPARGASDITYDAQGHWTWIVTFGEPSQDCTNTYDSEQRISERACTNDTHTYGYDASGRIDSCTVTPTDGDARTYVLTARRRWRGLTRPTQTIQTSRTAPAATWLVRSPALAGRCASKVSTSLLWS